MGTKEAPPKTNTEKKKNSGKEHEFEDKILELETKGYSREIASKIANIEHVIASAEKRRIKVAEGKGKEEIKEQRLLKEERKIKQKEGELKRLYEQKDTLTVEKTAEQNEKERIIASKTENLGLQKPELDKTEPEKKGLSPEEEKELAELEGQRKALLAQKAEAEAEAAKELEKESEKTKAPETIEPRTKKPEIKTEPEAKKSPEEPKMGPEKAEAEERKSELEILEERIQEHIKSLGLESLLSPEFENLEKEQKLLALETLKQRVIDVVKENAQTQYSEYMKEKMSKCGSVASFGKIIGSLQKIGAGIKENFKKESVLKDLESKVFREFLSKEEEKNWLKENLEQLVEINKDRQVYTLSKGPSYIPYTYNFFREKYMNNDLTSEEWKEVCVYGQEYDDAASKFRLIPYEWGQERKNLFGAKTGRQKEYEKAKKEYEEAYKKFFEIRLKRERPEEKGRTMVEMLQLRYALLLDQLLNTHPEFEKEFARLQDTAGGKEIWKGVRSATGTKTGINALLTAMGFLLRSGTKLGMGIAGASAATVGWTTFLAAPIIGGAIGDLRGRIRARETLQQREKGARYGQKDTSKEARNVEDAEQLIERMDVMLRAFQNAPTDEKKREKAEQLKRRLDYTQDRIEQGLVNFGDLRSSSFNQLNLIEKMDEALVTLGSENETAKNEVDARLKQFLSFKKEGINETQRKFIEKQALRGAALGAGFALVGYGARYLGEQLGWWGHPEMAGATEDSPSSNLVERAEKWMQNWNQKNMPEFENNEPTPEKIIEKVEKIVPVNTDAIVGKGEGIEHALIRQILHNPDLAKQLGFQGDVNDAAALKNFAGREAHILALRENLGNTGIKGSGGEIAYEIKMENGQPTLVAKTPDGQIISDPSQYEYEMKASAPIEPAEQVQSGEIDKDLSDRQTDPFEIPAEQKIPSEEITEGIQSEKQQAGIDPKLFIDPQNPSLLSDRGLKEVVRTCKESIAKMFPDKMDAWERIREAKETASANVLMGMDVSEVSPEYKNIVSYFHKLYKITGLRPIEESALNSAESPEEYLIRAVKKATLDGNLEKAKFNAGEVDYSSLREDPTAEIFKAKPIDFLEKELLKEKGILKTDESLHLPKTGKQVIAEESPAESVQEGEQPKKIIVDKQVNPNKPTPGADLGEEVLKRIEKVEDIYNSNIHYIFKNKGQFLAMWGQLFKHLNYSDMEKVLISDNIDKNFREPLAEYIETLRDATGLEPGADESLESWMKRCLKKAAFEGGRVFKKVTLWKNNY